MSDIPKLYETYAINTARFPALYDELASQLGVSVESVAKAEVGFIPVDEHDNQAWAFPERNAKGDVVGIHKRLDSGKKYAVTGSKRGLAYMVSHDITQYEGNYGWERTSAEYPCPLCNGISSDGSFKPSGCLYPKGEHDNPNAVICVRVSVGATKEVGLGHLHVFDLARQQAALQNHSLLLPTDRPILIVEGWSDVCAAYDIGFVAIGKPSGCSKQTAKDLIKLLTGRDVVIVGENDAGTGKAGMEATATSIQYKCKSVIKLMPPEWAKDLRQWVEKGLTQEGLLGYVKETGVELPESDIFKNDVARTIARHWLDNKWKDGDELLLRIFHNKYAQYSGQCYELVDESVVRGSVYDHVEDKYFHHSDGSVRLYKATRSKVSDILDSCQSFFPVDQPVPSWIGGNEGHPDPVRLATFTNGMLNINDWITTGKITMLDHDPRLFSFVTLPYAFDEDLESKLCMDFIADTFNQGEKQILLASQWFGYNIVPDRCFEKLMILLGVIRSGKGCVLRMLAKMLGDRNCASTSFQSLAGSFGVQPMLGKLSAIMGDARNTSKHDMNKALELILTITGGDTVSANRKNKLELPMIYLLCRFTMAMNSLPSFTDHSLALESRTNVLKFDNCHVGHEDTTLKAQLGKEAAEGKLINFALRGLRNLYITKEFVVPDDSAIALRTFRELISPVPYFARYCIEEDLGGPGVSIDYLYLVWTWWCKREGQTIGRKSKFVHTLRETLPNTSQIMDGNAGNPDRILTGIKITEWADKAQEQG